MIFTNSMYDNNNEPKYSTPGKAQKELCTIFQLSQQLYTKFLTK